jgi:hypothetical protein
MGSKRRIPLHFSLVKLGLLDYVAQAKAAGHTHAIVSAVDEGPQQSERFGGQMVFTARDKGWSH